MRRDNDTFISAVGANQFKELLGDNQSYYLKTNVVSKSTAKKDTIQK